MIIKYSYYYFFLRAFYLLVYYELDTLYGLSCFWFPTNFLLLYGLSCCLSRLTAGNLSNLTKSYNFTTFLFYLFLPCRHSIDTTQNRVHRD